MSESSARKPLSLLVVLVTIGATALLCAPPASASSSCRAVNVTSGDGPSSNLQQVLDDAQRRDVIAVVGTCFGGFRVRRTLTLVGHPTRAYPTPTLSGRDVEPVLRIRNRHVGRVSIRNLTITRGVAETHGGGVFSRSAAIVLRHSHVIRNSANKGGGIFSRAGALTIRRSVVADNDANRGGGVFVNDSSTVVRKGSRIRSNEAQILGGGVFLRAGDFRLAGPSHMNDNWAKRSGGALFNRSGVVHLRGESTLSANKSGRGGAISTEGRVVVHQRADLTGNTARKNGGAVYGRAPGAIAFKDRVSVGGNHAGISGGGVAILGGRVSVGGQVRMIRNDARNGGALASLGDVARIIVHHDATVAENSAKTGGAISFGGPVLVKGRAHIQANTAVDGGAIYDTCRSLCHGTYVHLSGDVLLTDNSASEDGGGINSGRGGVVLKDHSRVVANTAGLDGGGVYDASGGEVDRKGDVIVQDAARVSSNTAGGNGGGIWSSYTGSRVILLDEGSVRNNQATDGAGIYAELVRMFGTSMVTGNVAVARGGGIAAFGGGGRMRVSGSSTVEANQAGVAGGGIYTGGGISQGGDLWLEKSATITANASALGGGIHVDVGWVASLADSATVTANTASTEGGGIYNLGSVTFLDGWDGTVCGNDPDDYPLCSAR